MVYSGSFLYSLLWLTDTSASSVLSAEEVSCVVATGVAELGVETRLIASVQELGVSCQWSVVIFPLPLCPSATDTFTPVTSSRQSRRQSLQVGKPAHNAVSPTHWLLNGGTPLRVRG
ncbi:hypothetical protein [Dendronalium sp. ChiSLP03b]|uniref:hypothetical protein n=1 Tax=Dendronalium sp. ChiSLP03b TaxID=3075381 RepID=UPI00391B72EB